MRIIKRANYPQVAGGPIGRTPRLSRKELQHRLARQAAIERSKARYLKLDCEHYSTLERDEECSHWRPRRGVTWCDNCNAWVAISKPPPPIPLPDEPLF